MFAPGKFLEAGRRIRGCLGWNCPACCGAWTNVLHPEPTPTRFYVDWSLIVSKNDTAADRINKGFLDSLRCVINYRREQTLSCTRTPNRTTDDIKKDASHMHFTSVLIFYLQILSAADNWIHPSVLRSALAPARRSANSTIQEQINETPGLRNNGEDEDADDLVEQFSAPPTVTLTVEEVHERLQAANATQRVDDIDEYSAKAAPIQVVFFELAKRYGRGSEPLIRAQCWHPHQ